LLRAVTSDSNLNTVGNHRASAIPLKKKVITLKKKKWNTGRLKIIFIEKKILCVYRSIYSSRLKTTSIAQIT
jgi:hypothetical protein